MSQEMFTVNNLWIMLATTFVFIMHLGFACVEAGFVQKKNVVNILFKNSITPCIGLLTYAIMGFNLMYPGSDYAGGWFGFSGFGIASPEGDAGLIGYAGGKYTYWTDFIFQGMFAATCATIVSGAVAERAKLLPFMVFTTIFVMIAYPITGMWKWGGGWLNELGFHDFAGSSLVHSVGGWGALAGIILLGARKGKYTPTGIKPIPGHSMPLATIGVFLLWFGWYGFNGGSVLSADPGAVSLVFVTTSLGAVSGAIVAFVTAYFMFKSYDHSMLLNGILGGLVGITAGADVITPMEAIIIGAVAGALIPFAVVFFDKLKLDDPVGATSVHLVCGIWGTLAVGIFGEGKDIVAQLTGIAAIGVFSFTFAFILFYILKITVGIRVSESEEERGLDITEHEMEAYKMF
ncbi:MAG: ammonium transporter [Saprospiraceae bacterium]|nr:ammonium transporter [Saprospiraceae bacterium]MBK8635585.1 ammonium transporter [Saprospiraceae bacterium]MBP7643226.1 ammonium transporter [Saprospiraceae bacterium]